MNTAMRVCFVVTPILLVSLLGSAGYASSQAETGSECECGPGEFYGAYGESPLLAELVAAGELPPLDERIPHEPFVWQVPEIGSYGGTLIAFTTNINSWGDLQEAPTYNNLCNVMPDGSIVSNLARDFQWSNGGKTLTFFLREGLRWSDGAPVTAEDLAFAHNDIHHHELIGTWGTPTWAASLTVIDDYTVQLEYDEAYESTITTFAGWGASDWGALMPAHYYKPWHISYNEDADEIAREMGFESWNDRISWSLPFNGIQNDLERPTVAPFKMVHNSGDVKAYDRNPYHHIVDQEGNQLPYIDDILVQVVNLETYNLKVVSGEADVAWSDTSLDNYSLYKEGEDAGDYRVTLLPGVLANEHVIIFNLLSSDPVKGPILGDKRFRQAMSVAINREEINDILYQGVAVPRQPTIGPHASFFKPEWETSYARHDPAAATGLLDEMGLDARGDDGFRLAPSGEPFTMIVEHSRNDDKIFFLIEEYWENVGIDTQIVFEGPSLRNQRRAANVYDILAGGSGDSRFSEVQAWTNKGTLGVAMYYDPWAEWLVAHEAIAGGTATLADYGGSMPGTEPPNWIKHVRELRTLIAREPFRSENYMKYSAEFYDIQAEQLMMVGTVGMSPQVVIARNDIGNVPTAFLPDGEYAGSLNWFVIQLFHR